ncbi:sugar transferase [Rufibacter roseus]|uniref:Sugar transferase n=1 Tax=Rufibacter roseus TaxID=1567108 RepID=A0ABW2DPG0_9BACT|nr:sugar transferase [Rufibacter roseus]
MRFNRNVHVYKIVLADFVAAFLAWLVFYFSRYDFFFEAAGIKIPLIVGRSLIVASFWVILYALLGRYRHVFRLSRFREFLNLGTISFSGAVAVLIAFLVEDPIMLNTELYFKPIVSYFIIHFLLAVVFKMIALFHLKRLVKDGKVFFNSVLVGSSVNAREVYEEVKSNNHHLGLKFLGFVQSQPTQPDSFQEQLPCLGSFRGLPEVIQQHKIEEVVIAIEPSEHKLIEQILSSLEGENVRISILADVYQILLGSVKVQHLFGSPLIEIKRDLMPIWQQILKRAFDLSAAVIVLVLFSPLYAFLGFMVKMSSPGPIFFSQERVGLHGKPFQIYKFRSMYTDAEKMGPALSSDTDPRVTKIGRFMRKVRLDELPQFFNVLIGDMSIVGPRPERQFFIDLIMQEAPHYRHLQRVRPGITSLGQVKFGYAQNVQEMVRRLKYDILYIENMSLAMDFRVLMYTIKIIIEGRGK